MKWFDEHLNITYGLIIIAAIVIGGAITFTGNVVAYIIGALLSLILLLGGSTWILSKKGQSLWFLALFFVSVVLYIVALALPNKRTGQGETPKISDTDYYKEREAGTR